MASVSTSPITLPAPASTTWRQFQKALAAALGALAAGCAIYAVEKYLVAPRRRFMENPADVMMRAFGLAHFLVGWLFLFSSPRLRNLPALARLGSFTALGVVLCLAFAWMGAAKNPFVLMAFYSYFLIHEVRDQTHLFQTYGDAPPPSPELTRVLGALSTAFVLALMTLLIGVHLVHGKWLEKSPNLLHLPGEALIVGWFMLLAMTVWAGARVRTLGCRHFGELRLMMASLRPLLQVYAAIFGILLLGSLLGSVGLNIIILMHVCSWLVFVHRQASRSPAPAGSLWTWLRRTPAGFLTLHLALTAFVLVLMVLRVYAWERAGWISIAVAAGSFPYWGLLHISMAFWRR